MWKRTECRLQILQGLLELPNLLIFEHVWRNEWGDLTQVHVDTAWHAKLDSSGFPALATYSATIWWYPLTHFSFRTIDANNQNISMAKFLFSNTPLPQFALFQWCTPQFFLHWFNYHFLFGWIWWNHHFGLFDIYIYIYRYIHHLSSKSPSDQILQEMGAELFEKMKAFIMSRSKGAKSKLWGTAWWTACWPWCWMGSDVAMESYEYSLQTSTNVYKCLQTSINYKHL